MIPNYQYPMVPIMVFDQGRGPPVPSINVPQVHHLTNEIGRRIANEAGMQAGKNPLRMVAYNMLSENNWYNREFEDVFMLVIGHLLISMAKQGAPADSLYENSIESVLALHSSGLVYQFPQLRNVISTQLFQASSQNAGILHELRQEMQRVHTYGAPMQPVQQAGYGVQPIPNNPGWGIDLATGNMVQLQTPSVGVPMGAAFAYPTAPLQGFAGQRGTFGGGGGFGGTIRLQPVAMAQRPNESLTRDFGPMNERFSNDQRQPEQQARPAPQHHGSSTMGREGFRDFGVDDKRHPALSQSRHIQTASRMFEEYQPEVFTTRDLPKNGGGSHQQGETVKADQHEPTGRVIGPSDRDQEFLANITTGDGVDVTTLAGVEDSHSLEISIFRARMQLISDSNGPILRQYVRHYSAIMSGVRPAPYLTEWFTKKTMKEVIKELDESLNTIKLLASDGSHVTTLIREVDFLLTTRINDFLVNGLNLPRVITIQSAIEDYNELPGYLQDLFGRGAREELENYADALVEMLGSKDENAEIVLQVGDQEAENAAGLTSHVALTMFPVDRISLNLPVSTTPAKQHPEYSLLDTEKHAVVIGAVQSLFDPSHVENPFDGMIEKVIIVTRDNACYRVYRLAGLEQYHIKLL